MGKLFKYLKNLHTWTRNDANNNNDDNDNDNNDISNSNNKQAYPKAHRTSTNSSSSVVCDDICSLH